MSKEDFWKKEQILKKQSKLSELRWPIGIILAIMGVMALGVWTIEQANIKPVVMDDYYFDTYQDVETNINDIIKKQQAFDKKYHVDIDKKAFILGKNTLSIVIKTNTNKPVNDANITLKITRPDTNEFDKKPKLISQKNGVYNFESFDIQKIGRWQIMTKITTADQLISFSKNEVNATK